MVPSRLLIALLLAATPLFALGWYHPMLPMAGVGVMVAMLTAAVLDARISRARDRVQVQRCLPQVLSLGTANPVALVVSSHTGRPLRLVVKDDPPGGFLTSERTQPLRLEPWQQARLSYWTAPHRRGDYEFGDLHLRGLSRLGLSWWQRDLPARQSVRVYPNLQQIGEFDALARRGRLQELGLRMTRARGEGTEFESLREYVPDDSFRHVDWKATARRGEPITRQYQVERNQTLIILIDAGRMMAAPAAGMTQVDYAINAALMLAHVAQRMGDTVGLLVFSDRVKTFLAPAHGPAQTERMLEELYGLQAERVEPDFRGAVTLLRSRARKRALVCAFTDLVDTEISAQALSYLSSLRPQHLPLVATMVDAEVEALAQADPRHPREAYEKALAARTLAERALVLARLRARGALVCHARPEELSAAVVNQYLAIKRRGLL
ncbi:MAG: DUF58 domain-containing protein [Armatimonadota bacterium]